MKKRTVVSVMLAATMMVSSGIPVMGAEFISGEQAEASADFTDQSKDEQIAGFSENMNTVLAMNQIEDYLSGSENRSYADQTWKANAEGVDLNRNFDAGWDTYIGASGPSTECYKGTAPASEPEAQAVLSVAQNYDLDCCIAYHSYGNLIYWNYGSQDTVLDADQRLAQCVSDVTGYEMHSTVQDSTDAAGCSDYFVLNLGIPAVTIENGGSECPMPIEEYQPMYQRNQDLWAAVACLYKNS